MEARKNSVLPQAVGIVCLVILLYMAGRLLGLENRPVVVKSEMAVLMLTAALVCTWQAGRKNGRGMLQMIIVGGMVMRIGYMLYTGCMVRSHDLWEIDINSAGHAGYLLRLAEEHRLPESNALQLYQQPFYYLAGACFSKIINFFLGSRDPYYIVDAARTVSCSASCISLVVSRKLFEECGLDEEGTRNAMLLMAFLPVFYLTGGRVGPNALACLFMLLAFLYTLRWRKNPDWKNTLALAVIYGLGVMTKISVAALAPLTAVVFAEKLFGARKGEEKRTVRESILRKCFLLLKFAVFGCVSLPLGLWYSVRNRILFAQPFNYVLRQPDSSSLYTGMHSLPQRLLGIDIANLLAGPYANVYEDYNAPVYYVKSALFGEFVYDVPGWIPVMLLLCAVLLSAAVLAALIRQLVWGRKDGTGNLAAAVFLLYYVSVLWFYYRFPHGCSMDFRYMMFIAAPAGILLAGFMKNCPESRKGLKLLLWGEAFFSCLMYCMI